MASEEYLARSLDIAPDRAIAARFAPLACREALLLPVLLDDELRRVEGQVSEPTLYRIRLQFWREAVGEPSGGGVPLGKALTEAFPAEAGAESPLVALIDVHEHYIECDLTLEDRLRVHAAREAALFRLALLAVEAAPLTADIVDDAGRAYGFARDLCLAAGDAAMAPIAPRFAAQAADEWNRLRPLLAALSERQRLGLLPLALVPTYLRAFEKAADPAQGPIGISPLRRSWRLWRAAKGRF